jgi:hypothetical protein
MFVHAIAAALESNKSDLFFPKSFILFLSLEETQGNKNKREH